MTDSDYIETATGLWECVIGLEVHAQIISQSKLFSTASSAFGGEPNSHVALMDAAFPGMLPLPNLFCIEQGIKTGLGFNGKVHEISIFDRKNYFYADLPSGYQITQFHHPLVTEGYLDIDLPDGKIKRVRINRLHLEQDAGKSMHDQHPTKSYIDLNRAGVGLMEIVSEPDMRTAEEAASYIKKLRALMRYLETCDGNMEEGSLRADINVSVRRPGAPLNTRVEIKNVNSIRFLSQAIAYETDRQIAVIEAGGTIIQETRLFDPNAGETRAMRTKELAHDYRYFPDPDLPPIHIEAAVIEKIRKNLPELPDQKRQRLVDSFQLPLYDASILVSEKEIAAFYETALKVTGGDKTPAVTAKMLANWMMGDFFAALNRSGFVIDQSPVSPEKLAQLVLMIEQGLISGRIAKDVFIEMWETQAAPEDIVKAKGLLQVSDEGEIRRKIEEILAANGDKVADYRSGKDKLFGFFVGQVMKAMEGKGNPTLINDLLKTLLQG